MKIENALINNGLYSIRYSVTQVCNASATVSNQPNMDVKYAKLIEFHQTILLGEGRKGQIVRNHSSTLHGFLAFYGKTIESFVGGELRDSFEERLFKYLSTIEQRPKTLSDKRSHLRAWKSSFDRMLEQSRSGSGLRDAENNFTDALRRAVSVTGLAPKTLARQSKVSTSAMQRWIAGAEPNARTIPALRRLETSLGIQRNSLVKLLRSHMHAEEDSQPAQIPYRENLKRRTAEKYYLEEGSFTQQLMAEWREFFRYKTATHTRLARRNDAVWRLLPVSSINGQLSALAQVNGMGCSSAAIVVSRLRSYYGFLSMESRSGGLGLNVELIQTLAALAVPEWLEGYMEFLKNRSDGKTHEGHATFASFISSLVNPEFGYLWQKPKFADLIPEDVRDGRTWGELCSESLSLARAWKRAANEVSRDPVLPIQPLLNLAEPLMPVVRAVVSLDKRAAACLPGSVQQAALKRDALLLSIALENPLRLRTLSLITYNEGLGNLYKRGDEWRLRFKGDDFKNDTGARQDDYDVSIHSLNSRIEEYVFEFLPTLHAKCPGCRLLFPSTRSKDGKHSNLGRLVYSLTKKYIPEVLGFGPHAVRHLVASAYLKKHPKDFLTVAVLLHDELATVMKRYAHLAKDDSLKRYSDHVAEVRASHGF